MKTKVLLLNRELGSHCVLGRVQGYSGKTYATSRYLIGHNAHVAELSLEDYNAAIEDISRNWHRPNCRWVPKFVQTPDEAESLKVLREVPVSLLLQVLDERSAPKIPTIPAPLQLKSEALVQTFDSLKELHFLTLKKMARAAGIDADQFKTRETLATAIIEAQQKA